MFKKKPKELAEYELIEDELDKDVPEISPFNFKEFINILKNKTDEDIEYESLLTEEEKLEELNEQKEIKKLLIKAGSIVVLIVLFIIGGMSLFFKINESELDSITKPILRDYYQENYNRNITFSSIEEICFKDKNNEQQCDGLVLATTKHNEHIIAINNDNIGDDINTKIIDDLNSFITKRLNNKMLLQEIKYSYQDYYYDYNLKLPYINVLPNKPIEQLLDSKKVTISYRGIYDEDININEFANLLNYFSEDSKVYLIKENNSMPTKMYILSKNKINEINITGNRLLEDKIYAFEYKKSQNNITSSTITQYVDSKLVNYKNYKLSNIMEINFDKNNYNNEEELPGYYLFRIDSSMIASSNLIQVEKNNDNYKEKSVEDYYNLITISFGGHTYIIGEEKIIIGTLTKNKSFLCNLGIC